MLSPDDQRLQIVSYNPARFSSGDSITIDSLDTAQSILPVCRLDRPSLATGYSFDATGRRCFSSCLVLYPLLTGQCSVTEQRPLVLNQICLEAFFTSVSRLLRWTKTSSLAVSIFARKKRIFLARQLKYFIRFAKSFRYF